jgi:hypothetical protein
MHNSILIASGISNVSPELESTQITAEGSCNCGNVHVTVTSLPSVINAFVSASTTEGKPFVSVSRESLDIAVTDPHRADATQKSSSNSATLDENATSIPPMSLGQVISTCVLENTSDKPISGGVVGASSSTPSMDMSIRPLYCSSCNDSPVLVLELATTPIGLNSSRGGGGRSEISNFLATQLIYTDDSNNRSSSVNNVNRYVFYAVDVSRMSFYSSTLRNKSSLSSTQEDEKSASKQQENDQLPPLEGVILFHEWQGQGISVSKTSTSIATYSGLGCHRENIQPSLAFIPTSASWPYTWGESSHFAKIDTQDDEEEERKGKGGSDKSIIITSLLSQANRQVNGGGGGREYRQRSSTGTSSSSISQHGQQHRGVGHPLRTIHESSDENRMSSTTSPSQNSNMKTKNVTSIENNTSSSSLPSPRLSPRSSATTLSSSTSPRSNSSSYESDSVKG